jgi:hypothetical protein
MSIASTASVSAWYATNGATRTWNYGFKIPALANVVVDIRDDATGLVTTSAVNISGTGFGLEAGGVITYPILPNAALAAGYSVRVRRVTSKQQTLVLKNQAAWNPSDIEGALDLAAMRDQERADAIAQLQLDIVPALSAAVEAAASAATATAQAGIATTQAGIATTQAGISTTKAGEANTSAGNASSSASAAAASAAAAIAALAGIRLLFSTTTADADPGNGYVRLGNATQNAAVVMRVDLLDRFGVNVTSILDSLDVSTNVSNKAIFRLTAEADSNRWLEFRMSARATPSGYRNFTIVNTGGSATSPLVNNEAVVLTYRLSGDKGTDGAGTGDVVGPASAVSGNLVTFNGTTGKLVQDGGTKGALANKNTVAAADIDANAVTTVKIPDANVTYAKLTNVATAAEYRANTASRILDTAGVWSAAAPVALAYGATITPDFGAGFNFDVGTLTGSPSLANPTGKKAGQCGILRFVQDATGSRVVSAGSDYVGFPVLSTGANAIDYVSYHVTTAGKVLCAMLQKGAAA